MASLFVSFRAVTRAGGSIQGCAVISHRRAPKNVNDVQGTIHIIQEEGDYTEVVLQNWKELEGDEDAMPGQRILYGAQLASI